VYLADFFQRLSQLIGAGGGLGAAVDAFHTGDDIIDIHALYQSGNPLQVAVAASEELNILHLAVFYFENDLTGAGTLGLVSILHSSFPFLTDFFLLYSMFSIYSRGNYLLICGVS